MLIVYQRFLFTGPVPKKIYYYYSQIIYNVVHSITKLVS